MKMIQKICLVLLLTTFSSVNAWKESPPSEWDNYCGNDDVFTLCVQEKPQGNYVDERVFFGDWEYISYGSWGL